MSQFFIIDYMENQINVFKNFIVRLKSTFRPNHIENFFLVMEIRSVDLSSRKVTVKKTDIKVFFKVWH